MASRTASVLFASSALAAMLALAGCSVVPGETDATSSPSPEISDPSTPDPSDTPTAAPTATPVDVACDTLVSAQAMYDFNPNFSLIDAWEPSDGSPAAQARGFAGTACRWVNGTSGETIEVAVASPGAGDLAALRTAASAGSAVSVTGADAAFFATSGGAGQVSVFDGPYWVNVRSSFFVEAGDAQPIVDDVVAALG